MMKKENKSRLLVSTFVLLSLCCTTLVGQQSGGPPKGTLIVDGGGTTTPIKDRFVTLAGGANARIVAIPTGASALKFGPKDTILDLKWPRERPEWKGYEDDLKKWFGVENVTVIHTRDRAIADSKEFVKPLQTATGVFLGTGNAGRFADAYLTRGHRRNCAHCLTGEE